MTAGRISAPDLDALRKAARLWRYVSRDAQTGCWNWTGTLCPQGYGRIYTCGRLHGAHRLAFELHYGTALPFWADVDHLCHNPACVNPEHLEAVSHRENMRRRRPVVSRTHCPHGHEWLPGSYTTNATSGARICLVCNRARCRADYRRRKGVKPEPSLAAAPGAPESNVNEPIHRPQHGDGVIHEDRQAFRVPDAAPHVH
jgi:hypothetical protein